jgi:glycosyltransferase involved in cell wall biosynthesis
MPVYNGEPLLREAIDSLLAQTHEDFELIISDNASTDGTEAICRAYADADRRVRYYRAERNNGLCWNYNRAFELSRGEYFKWAAHDDVCAPEFVERCVEVLEKDPSVVLCYTRTVLIDENGEQLRDCRDPGTLGSPKPHVRFRDLLRGLGMSNPLFGVIRASALRNTPLVASYVASDIPLLGHLALLGQFHEVPECLFLRRDHPRKSDRANPTLDRVAEVYDPNNRGKIHMLNWRLFFAHLASIRQVRMGAREKLHCYLHMGRWLRWRWTDLGSELIGASGQVLRRWTQA